jgi:putative endonuclease
MSQRSNALGASGERIAVERLSERGYRIVDCNVRPVGGHSRGELDIIAWHGPTLVFIEVKSRRAVPGVETAPILAVDYRKRRQIIRLAEVYLARYRLDDVPVRFDIVEILYSPNALPQVRLHQAAFDGSDI